MSNSLPYRYAHWGPAVGMVSVVLFLACFLWGFLITNPEVQAQHMMTFRILFFDAGFVGLNFITFIVGVIVSYIGGMFLGLVLAKCLNHCQRWFP